jgi:PAS domain S-box-containing protein
MRFLTRRVPTVDMVAAAYAAAFFVWLAVRTPGTATTELVGAVAFYPLGLAVAWANWNNSGLPGLDRPTRLAWRLLALSAFMLFVSGNAGDIYVRLAGTRAAPEWVSHLRLIYSTLLAAACLVFPARRFEGRSQTRLLLDATLIVIAGLAVALYFGLKLWSGIPQYESIAVTLSGHVLDCAVFVVAAVGSIQKRDRGTRVALLFWVLAVTVFIGANYVFIATLSGPGESTFRSGDPVDGLWFGAWVFRWLAARVSRCVYARDRALPARAADSGSPEYQSSRFSYLIVGAAFLLLIGRIYARDHQYLGLLAVSAAVMIVLLVVRQIVELQENDRLFDRQLAQEARFQSLVRHSSDIMLVVDSGGMISFASPAAARVFGADSPVRTGSRLLDVVREEDLAGLAPVLATGRGPRRLLFHLPAGQEKWLEIEALWSDLRDDPAVKGIVINCRDITERSELKRRLRHAQRLDAVGRLTDGLAHDVNNALTIIRGFAELLESEVPRASPAAHDLAHIREAVDRAGVLTGRVLAFSRRQPTQRVVVDLNGLIQDLFSVLNQSVTPNVAVRLTLALDLWTVRVDPGQIEQVLVNLATNARDAMPDGGTLDVATANRRIETASPETGDLPPGDYVSMVVTDCGTGMSADVLARIFEPFFSTKVHGAGMGLGLAMVRAIVRDFEGHVLVESVPGRGSSFTILLPRTFEPAAAKEKEAAAARPVRAHTVLVVDDEAFVREVARRILERHGYRVIEAPDGRQALALIADPSTQFDVLLTDLVMPGLHGRQLIARCEEFRPSVPVVCMTGFAGDGDDPRQYGHNLVEILSKPFTAEGLARSIAGALAGRGVS